MKVLDEVVVRGTALRYNRYLCITRNCCMKVVRMAVGAETELAALGSV